MRQKIAAASVRVEWRIGNGRMQCGSGVVVDVDPVRQTALVITCKHVLPTDPAEKRNVVYELKDTSAPQLYAGESPIRIYHPSGKLWYATWLTAAAHDDLAACMIDVSKYSVTPARLAASQPKAGWLALQAGYPGGTHKLNHRLGTVSAKQGMRGTSPVWLLNMACESGDSGSGIFDGDGDLTAILWGGAGNETCCTGLGELRAFIEYCHRWVRPRRPAQPPARPSPTQPPPSMPPTAPSPAPSPAPSMPPAEPPPVGPDQSAVLAALGELRKDLAELKARPAPKDGKDGRDGIDGKDADVGPLLIQIEAMKATIARLETSAATKAELDGLKADLVRLQQTIANLSGTIRLRLEPTQK